MPATGASAAARFRRARAVVAAGGVLEEPDSFDEWRFVQEVVAKELSVDEGGPHSVTAFLIRNC
jgi:hypothetical protein